MNDTIAYYSFPTDIACGVGAIDLLPHVLSTAAKQHVLLITDKSLATLPITKRVSALIENAGLQLDVFDGVFGNPTDVQVSAGVDCLKASQADCIVALGGGAPMDVAKAVSLMARHPGHIFDYLDGDPKALSIDKPLMDWLAVPTTAGTGSEVGRSSVISDAERHAKHIIFSPHLLPQYVFADPTLLLDLPATITAATGMDAISHLAEAFLSPVSHPMCDAIALAGLRLVQNGLLRSYKAAKEHEGASDEHLQAREQMLNAAMMGAVAFQKGLGATHSCAHALSAVCDMHHGLANGVMIGIVMRWNASACEDKMRQMAMAVGQKDYDFCRWLNMLQDALQLPRLHQLGVDASQIDALVEYALADPCHQTNVRPVQRQDFNRFFMEALSQ